MKHLFLVLTLFTSLAVAGQTQVVLTYDDALDGHLDRVIPALDSLGLKGTFYLTASSPAFITRTAAWKAAAQRGHELGNHSLFHPCLGDQPGRSWVTPEYDLNNYTVKRMVDELRFSNNLLTSVDGKSTRTYAYTCGDMVLHDTLFMDSMKNDFVAARGVERELLSKPVRNLYNLGSYVGDNNSGAEMISWVKEAMKEKATIVFLFHGVGGGHPINITAQAHRELLQFLAANKKDIVVKTFIEAAEQLK